MKLLNLKKILSVGCAAVCLLSFSGCQALLDYVDAYVPPTTPVAFTTPPDTTTIPGETDPEPTQPVQPTLTGVITGAKILNVRSGPGVEHEKVGALEDGTKVAIYEQQVVGDSTWGRIKSGWISMKYVRIINTGNSEITTTHSIIATITSENLNIRKGPSTGYDVVDNLGAGDKVQITSIYVRNKTLWGKVKKGWVCMTYVSIDGTPNGELRLSGTVNTSNLTIRSGPGTKNPEIGSYTQGEKIIVTQLEEAAGSPWGKTDLGWICMNFVIPDGDITVSAD